MKKNFNEKKFKLEKSKKNRSENYDHNKDKLPKNLTPSGWVVRYRGLAKLFNRSSLKPQSSNL